MPSACRVVASPAFPGAPPRCVPTPPRRSRAARASRSRSSRCPSGSCSLFLPQRLLAVFLSPAVARRNGAAGFAPKGTGRPPSPPRGLPRAPVVTIPERGVVAGGPRRDPGEGKNEVALSQEPPSSSGHVQMAKSLQHPPCWGPGAGLGAVSSAPCCFPGCFLTQPGPSPRGAVFFCEQPLLFRQKAAAGVGGSFFRSAQAFLWPERTISGVLPLFFCLMTRSEMRAPLQLLLVSWNKRWCV